MDEININIDEVYDLYKRNLIRLINHFGIKYCSPLDLTVRYTEKNEDAKHTYSVNPWIRNEAKYQELKDSLRNNGTYFTFVIYKDKDICVMGTHRIVAFQELHKEGYENKVLCYETSTNYDGTFEPFVIERFDKDNITDKPIKTYCTCHADIMINIINIGCYLQNPLYFYKLLNDKEYTTSLLCNNYDCLMGAVAHYKETDEFIIDNEELSKRFL